MRRVLVTTTTTITFMVALATAIPPPPPPMSEPPPPISTPPPPRCRLEDGSEVEGLVPGGTVFRGCDFCECSWDGSEARCYLIHCEPPRCADPEEGECCPTCPNGKGSNSLVPGTEYGGYTHTNMCPRAHANTSTQAHSRSPHSHVRTHTHTHIHTYTTHMSARARAHTHTHTHTYTHTQSINQ